MHVPLTRTVPVYSYRASISLDESGVQRARDFIELDVNESFLRQNHAFHGAQMSLQHSWLWKHQRLADLSNTLLKLVNLQAPALERILLSADSLCAVIPIQTVLSP